MDKTASESGRDPDDVKITSLVMVVADPDDGKSMDAMRRGLAFYCASEHYLHIEDISGLGAEARRVNAAWQTKDFKKAAENYQQRWAAFEDVFKAIRARPIGGDHALRMFRVLNRFEDVIRNLMLRLGLDGVKVHAHSSE